MNLLIRYNLELYSVLVKNLPMYLHINDIRKCFIILAGLTLFWGNPINATAQIKRLSNGDIILDDFQSDTVGHLPYNWYDRDGNQKTQFFTPEERQEYKYSIRQEGSNKYLHYAGTMARHLNFPLVKKKWINLRKTPILSWRWRVYKVPKGGNENDKSLNDSAAGVYVVYGFVGLFKIPKSIKYAWSATLPVGTILSKNFNEQKIIILNSGMKNSGKWITVRRNIAQDYRNLFGEQPPNRPIAILVLSDGDSTGNEAIADYDDFELRPVDTTTN